MRAGASRPGKSRRVKSKPRLDHEASGAIDKSPQRRSNATGRSTPQRVGQLARIAVQPAQVSVRPNEAPSLASPFAHI